MITNYEQQYMDALSRIYYNGYSDGVNERTGYSTKRLPGIVICVDVEKEFPILKSKFVAGKTALREIEWIWKQQSNRITDLKAHIWDQWQDENGTIGSAYGYQIGKPIDIYTDPVHKTAESFRHYDNQAQFILEYLREFPTGRWGVATLWNISDLSEMNLVPCCHTSTWNLDGGRLNCVLDQRSGDMPYGVPFNTTQYAELMIMFARDLGVKPGILTHVIADAHIYENQMEGVQKQLRYYEALKIGDEIYASDLLALAKELGINEDENTYMKVREKIKEVLLCEPHFVIDTNETNFFKYNADVCRIEDYQNMGKIDFGDVAV